MTRRRRILLGLLTILPLLVSLAPPEWLPAWWFSRALSAQAQGAHHVVGPAVFFSLMLRALLWILPLFWLWGFYLYHLTHYNHSLSAGWKAAWAVLLCLGSVAAWPVYWYLFVWRAPAAHA